MIRKRFQMKPSAKREQKKRIATEVTIRREMMNLLCFLKRSRGQSHLIKYQRVLLRILDPSHQYDLLQNSAPKTNPMIPLDLEIA